MGASAVPQLSPAAKPEAATQLEGAWRVVVLNDPVNLMSYVVLVFQKLFGYSKEHATRLMLEVRHDGRSVVASGTREQAEHHVARLHAHGLWATTQRDS